VTASRDPAPLHHRNRHTGRYDFAKLTAASPELAAFVHVSPRGEPTIDFAEPAAVTALNRALLRLHYGVTQWDLPRGALCPPIPSRADYLHYVADLLTETAGGGAHAAPPRGPGVRLLDIGTGASCIYPILGTKEYGWRFVATELDPVSISWAQRLLDVDDALRRDVELRRQTSAKQVFRGVIHPGETFAACVCNPPFHASPSEAAAGTARKHTNLHGFRSPKPQLNFGGRSNELWCEGGEVGFVRRMIAESAAMPELCRWFTTLVSKRESLAPLEHALARAHAAEIRIIPMSAGQKKTRVLAWRFRSPSAAT
jgi:23S rRNA (adenine1618-N6)-methyltransferase